MGDFQPMKQRCRAVLIAVSVLCLAAMPAWADGTVSFQSDVLPMLKAKPEFERFLLGTLKVNDTGSGTRISNQAMPHLGGARMGPYEFQASWRDAGGDVPVTLIIDTEVKFFDKAGREITSGGLKKAISFRETFAGMEIEPRR